MKLFSISRTFDKKQWSNFLVYLKLYHKSDGVVDRVVKWIDSENLWRDRSENDIDVNSLLLRCPFKIKQQTLANTITKLGNCAEEYLGWIVWKNSENLKTSCKLLGLAQKSLSDQYLQNQKDVFTEAGNSNHSIWDEHYKMFALFNNYYFGLSSPENNYTEEFSRLIESFIQSTASIAQLLKVEIKNREKLLAESWTTQLKYLDEICSLTTPLKEITDNLILMNFYGNDNSYHLLRAKLDNANNLKLSLHVQYSIVSYCINLFFVLDLI